MPLARFAVLFVLFVLPLASAPTLQAQKGILHDQTALLRESPKHFVTVLAANTATRTLRVRIEGEAEDTVLDVDPDAEVKIHGTWGSLGQLVPGDRAWIWMHAPRKQAPRKQATRKQVRGRVFVVADEVSEQEIHGLPYEITGADAAKRKVFLRRRDGKKKQQTRALDLHPSIAIEALGDLVLFRPEKGASPLQSKTEIKPGDRVFVQTAGNQIRVLWDLRTAQAMRHEQELRVRGEFRAEGLPASVAACHPFAGEIEVLVDHAAMRWARYQKSGSEVTLVLDEPVRGVLRHVAAWHEKTRLRIATRGPDLRDVRPGDRVRVQVVAPPAKVLDADAPAGLGRAKTKDARTAWFLANTYCTCSIDGDGCTGMFYTLSSCNETRCGMPKKIRGLLHEWIDVGKTDEEILTELKKARGRGLLRPHLLR